MIASRRWVLAGLATVIIVLLGAALASNSITRGAADTIIRRASAVIARVGYAPPPPPASVTIRVDTSRVLRSISPLIYGVSHASADELTALGAQLNRWGGNPNSRYNWELGNAWNAARDYEFRNYGQAPATAAPAADSFSDLFVIANRRVYVETEFSVPAIGWVARNGDTETRSIGVPAMGGPPLVPGGDAIANYDPTTNREHTSLPSFARKGAPFADPPDLKDGRVFQDEWINHLVNRFGSAENDGVHYYAIDNEPDIWSYTHADVHPVQPSYDDMLSTYLDYATAIKSVDPTAYVAGPALSGWTGYFNSARDQGADAYRTHADRQAHGDMPFLPWWLDQVRKHDEQTGQRSLDVLDVHYYPQASGVFSAADDPQTRGLRLRSTRSLWDPTYIDESWINEPVRLIPRLREWVDQYYPGTRLAIGEWNWGGEKSMSGALALADVLGIFGREGVDMATYWTFPPVNSAAGRAFAMYAHYDDRGDGFGDQVLAANVNASPDYVTSYASLDSATGDIVIIAINKRADADLPATIQLSGDPRRSAAIYRLGAGDAAIESVGSVPISGSELHLVLSASSISLVRVAQ